MLFLALAPLVFAGALAAPASSGAAPPLGALSQLASPFNCIGEEEFHQPEIGCGTLLPKEAINSSYQAQVSPDGKNVYSVAIGGALIEYARNATSGSLTPIGCVTSGEAACAPSNTLAHAVAMSNPAAIAISPGGEDLYVVTQGSNSLVELKRDPATGLLSELGCISRENSGCAAHEAKGLNLPYGVAVSPDGKNIYVASHNDEAVAEFSRDPSTGVATQLASPNECVSSTVGSGCAADTALGLEKAIGVTVSPDGGNVYVAAGGTEPGGAIAAFERDPTTGALTQLPGKAGCVSDTNAACETGTAINGPEDLLVSPDGRNVYANSSKENAVLEFRREPSGALAQLAAPNACVMNATALAGCSQVKGLQEALGVAISPDGENVYASSPQEDDEAAFARNGETGALTPLPAPYECAGKVERSTCGATDITGIAGARRVTVSPDGKNLYVAGQNDHSVVELVRAGPPPAPANLPAPETTSPPLAAPLVPIAPLSVPAPVLARTGNVAPVSGKVLVKLPGTSTFVPLSSLRQIPFGSVIDATNGTVSVTTAIPGGKTQTGQFFSGEFILRQGPNGLVVAELTGGNFSVCPTKRERAHIARAGSALARAAASKSHVVRKLWANAHGKFSTKGNYAAGAVQGTEWLTEDLCDGTLIRVTRDKVAVTNLVNHRHVEVKKGHKYLAKAP
jgi:DNA-binding beta-propeller fold protein YncE